MATVKLTDTDALRKAVRDDPNIEPMTYARIMRHIIEAKREDAVPVVHGRWVWFEDGWWQCSECACCPADWEPDHDNEYGLPPYCHCCGAKMDLEVSKDG